MIVILICFAVLVGFRIWTRREGWLILWSFLSFFFPFNSIMWLNTVKSLLTRELFIVIQNFTASENGGSSANAPRNGTPVSQTVPIMPMPAAGPPTNLNIGMEYWGAPPTSAAIPGMHGKATTSSVPGVVPPVSRDGGHSQPWLQVCALLWSYSFSLILRFKVCDPQNLKMLLSCNQDDREVKRQKRKQSNRESARRSRLRKQVN